MGTHCGTRVILMALEKSSLVSKSKSIETCSISFTHFTQAHEILQKFSRYYSHSDQIKGSQLEVTHEFSMQVFNDTDFHTSHACDRRI